MTSPVAIIAQKFPQIVIPLIKAAKGSIRVVVFDWRFYPTVLGSPISQFNAAFADAARRGVDVRCLVNNDDVVARLGTIKCKARKLHSKRMLHTKMIIIDERLVIIGSHNYTQHGFSLNHEASVLVEMENIDNEFVKYFDGLYGL